MNQSNKSVTEEIECARLTLKLQATAVRRLPDDEAASVFYAAEAHFFASTNRYWWWEDFRLPALSIHFVDGSGFERLTQIVPCPTESVWWIVEEGSLPVFPVYEANTTTIQQIIGECYAFEYYIVAKDLSWLVCETHSDTVYAIGTAVQNRLQHAARV